MHRNFRLTLTVLIVLIGFGLVYAGAEKTVKKSFDVGSGGTLFIESDMGSIHVETSASDNVETVIRIKLKNGDDSKLERLLKELDLDSGQYGNNVTITLEKKNDSWWKSFKYNGLSVRFDVTVPEKYNVDLKTSGGSISVADLQGTADVATSGGSLSMGNIEGPINGHTSGGSITVESCQGDVNVKTSGGSLKLGKIAGTVVGHTSGGSIHVEEVMGMIEAKTSGGSIHASIAEQPSETCILSTSGGNVTAYLADDIGMHVDAKTSGGGVSTDFPVKIQGKIGGKSLNADINGGGPLLKMRTSGGSIRIKQL